MFGLMQYAEKQISNILYNKQLQKKSSNFIKNIKHT